MYVYFCQKTFEVLVRDDERGDWVKVDEEPFRSDAEWAASWYACLGDRVKIVERKFDGLYLWREEG